MEASKLGFGVVIGRSKNDTSIRQAFVVMTCERSGKYVSKIRKLKHDDTGSRKCECPFKLRASCRVDGLWRFSVISENRKVVKLECRSPSLDTKGNIKFTSSELKNEDNLEVMKATFERYSSKGPIEEDAKLQRSREYEFDYVCPKDEFGDAYPK
ncbi:uncharacterized protein LOC131650671 [Vicia villosa]|uniref:uncharacterized protein LOC131650671 n=1 Tax=Vicia villosa TaxID=3911 RepID=UPI00273C665F|nr:uncharacterized protein LOC131650671 [Vicia villosa]